MTTPFARVPGAVTDESGLRHLGNPLYLPPIGTGAPPNGNIHGRPI